MRYFQIISKRQKLKRKNVQTCSTDTERERIGSLLGYRAVHHQKLRSRGIVTDKESARTCMKVLDPLRVSPRKQQIGQTLTLK